MKTIGILGGMGPASTLYYYETLCRLTREQQGGNASPPVLLHAFNFGDMQALQEAGAWGDIGERLQEAAEGLVRQGAGILLLATNTMHKVAGQLERQFAERFIHIADATGARLKADGRLLTALIGTHYTMQEDFYRSRIESVTGVPVSVPDQRDQEMIQNAIFSELVNGIVTPETETAFIAIAERLRNDGADSLILGCTEIGLVLNTDNCPLPVYDTARIHCEAAIERAQSRG